MFGRPSSNSFLLPVTSVVLVGLFCLSTLQTGKEKKKQQHEILLREIKKRIQILLIPPFFFCLNNNIGINYKGRDKCS
jgi:hypothetical protein